MPFFTEEKKDDELRIAKSNSSSSLDLNIIEQEDTGVFEDDAEDEEKKVVKFADVEAEKHDAQRDQERSRQELLSKIARLTDSLKEAQENIKFEKDKRKKKEKSLLKLAKELKKRNLQREQDEDRFEELEEKRKYLEHHWVLAQKELDQEKALHAKLHEDTEKEYDQGMKEEKSKYERMSKENETRLADLKKAHIEQCEQLGREAWKANLEADRLHEELIARGLDVPRRTLANEERPAVRDQSRLQLIILYFSIISSIIYAYLGNDIKEIFSRKGICAPLIPGTTLDDNAYGVFEAPWWAPAVFKEQMFTAICTEGGFNSALSKTFSTPSSIEWARDGKNNRLVVSTQGKAVLKRSTAKAQIKVNYIEFWKRNGYSDEVPVDWLPKS